LRTAVFSGLTAESAVEQIQAENRSRMQQARDPYLKERLLDLEDLSYRLLRHLTGEIVDQTSLPEDAIVIARSMGPADLLEYDREKLKGVVLGEGSATSHVAIVARALGIPLVSGVDISLGVAESGDSIIIDGESGVIQIRPTTEIQQSYREKKELRSEQQAAFARERDLPAVTTDGIEIEIQMNAGLALDLPHLEATGANGVGLFRTELQFLIGSQLPRVSAQTKLYGEVLDLAGGKPVVFRTADLGGDKTATYMKRGHELNPAMGWRGIRMAVDRPGILRPQIRALLSAAADRDLYILFPMITLASEITFARQLLAKEIDFRRKRAQKLPAAVKVGAMIETPAAAWRLCEIASNVDFLSVGGNDLAQFYFAADRDSELTQRRYDPLEPGFLSFMKVVVEKAEKARAPLSYCGEQAADPVMAAALIAIGVDRFSIPATAVGAFRRLVRSVSRDDLAEWLMPRLEREGGSVRRELSLFLRGHGAWLG
jgi:phosphotransferase system enzyme I (PtsP)